MAELSEIQKVLAKGELTNLPHWKIYAGNDAKTGKVVAQSDLMPVNMPADSISWATTKPYLEQNLCVLPEGTYLIQFKRNPTDNNNLINHVFVIGATHGAISGNTLPVHAQQPQGLTFAMFLEAQQKSFENQMALQMQMLKNSFETKAYADEIESLKRKVKEKSKAPVWLEQVVKIGLPMLQQVLSGKPGPDVNIAGVGGDAVPPVKDRPENDLEDVSPEQAKLLQQIHAETMQGFTDFFEGDETEVIKALYCVKELLIANPAVYHSVIAPMLLPYREKLKQRGVDTGS